MKSFFPLFAALAALSGGPALLAQQNPGGNRNNQDRPEPRPNPAPARQVLWKAELPGGSFVVSRDAINAVSMQQYILDGAARVTEVNISIAGNFQPRFYYLEALPAAAAQALPAGQAVADRAQSEGQAAVNRVVPGDPIWAKVVKNYPSTTHAGTIEFRLETADQLDKLFQSVERVWTTGKGEVFTPEGAQSYRARKKEEAEEASSFGETGPGGEN